jgi:hypothetical protein
MASQSTQEQTAVCDEQKDGLEELTSVIDEIVPTASALILTASSGSSDEK